MSAIKFIFLTCLMFSFTALSQKKKMSFAEVKKIEKKPESYFSDEVIMQDLFPKLGNYFFKNKDKDLDYFSVKNFIMYYQKQSPDDRKVLKFEMNLIKNNDEMSDHSFEVEDGQFIVFKKGTKARFYNVILLADYFLDNNIPLDEMFRKQHKLFKDPEFKLIALSQFHWQIKAGPYIASIRDRVNTERERRRKEQKELLTFKEEFIKNRQNENDEKIVTENKTSNINNVVRPEHVLLTTECIDNSIILENEEVQKLLSADQILLGTLKNIEESFYSVSQKQSNEITSSVVKRRSVQFPEIKSTQKLIIETADLNENDQILVKFYSKNSIVKEEIISSQGSTEYDLHLRIGGEIESKEAYSRIELIWQKSNREVSESPEIKSTLVYTTLLEELEINSDPSSAEVNKAWSEFDAKIKKHSGSDLVISMDLKNAMSKIASKLDFYNKNVLSDLGDLKGNKLSESYLCENKKVINKVKLCFLPMANDRYNAMFSKFKSLMRGYGFQVKELNSSHLHGSEGLAPHIKDCSQLWIVLYDKTDYGNSSRDISEENIKDVVDFAKTGRGLMLWGDNSGRVDYYNYFSGSKTYENMPANRFLKHLTGENVVTTDYGNRAQINVDVNHRRHQNGHLKNPILFGLDKVYEGHTISAINKEFEKKMNPKMYTPIIRSPTDKTIVSLSAENKCKSRWVFDGAFTRGIDQNIDIKSTRKYLINIACYLTHFDLFYEEFIN
ncbi:hypothetical protein N9N67_07380 [Bacteriovoracaceae bacterium]|nr:hypothetical protein [Bacteriovoracaceae bacterium]